MHKQSPTTTSQTEGYIWSAQKHLKMYVKSIVSYLLFKSIAYNYLLFLNYISKKNQKEGRTMPLSHIFMFIFIITAHISNSASLPTGTKESVTEKETKHEGETAAQKAIRLQAEEEQHYKLFGYRRWQRITPPEPPQRYPGERETKGEFAIISSSQAPSAAELNLTEDELKQLLRMQQDLEQKKAQRPLPTYTAAAPIAESAHSVAKNIPLPQEILEALTDASPTDEELKNIGIPTEEQKNQAQLLEEAMTAAKVLSSMTLLEFTTKIKELLTLYHNIPTQIKNTRVGWGASTRAKAKNAITEFLNTLKQVITLDNKESIEKNILDAYQAVIKDVILPKDIDSTTNPDAYNNWVLLIDGLHKLIPKIYVNTLIP